MGLDIDKNEMDQAWIDRLTSNQFYKYLYSIARHQVAKKGIALSDREDYIQFALYKCYSHQNSFNKSKGHAYSFFWKQIALSISYKLRKIRKHKNKVNTIYVEQDKILDWADAIQQQKEGVAFNDIVDLEELQTLKAAYKKYNSAHKGKQIKRLKPNKENTVKVVKWMEKTSPGFVENFTTLKSIFKYWLSEDNISI